MVSGVTTGRSRWSRASRGGDPQRGRRAFTLVELLTVIAIISVLAALAFPAFSRVREVARGTVCLSNLKQLGTAVTLYLQDYGEVYPMSRFPDATHALTGCVSQNGGMPEDGLQGSSVNWKRVLEPYAKNRAVYQCPSNAYAFERGGYNGNSGDETNLYYPQAQWLANSYAYNGGFFHEAVPACWYGEKWERPRSLVEIDQPSRLILLLESRYSFPDLGSWFIPLREPRGGSGGPFQSHSGACNWLFADQHAKRLKLAATCTGHMWTDRYVDPLGGCNQLDHMAVEYR